jgi:hypothetical protein
MKGPSSFEKTAGVGRGVSGEEAFPGRSSSDSGG